MRGKYGRIQGDGQYFDENCTVKLNYSIICTGKIPLTHCRSEDKKSCVFFNISVHRVPSRIGERDIFDYKGELKMKFTTASFTKAKQSGDKITMLTAYDYSTARLEDEAGVDAILVGDSLGMVVLGYENTLSVTMEDMIHHSRAVSRGAKNAMVVTDMPFMSYQTSVYDAVQNAGRLIKEGHADAVKLEGGVKFAEHIRAVSDASIPVMGHIGMTPQSVNTFGGFKVQGKSEEEAKRVIADAKAVQDAGAFAVVMECVPSALTAYISRLLDIPVIGIGAGAGCDGQVLVYQDMLGMYSDFTPKFVKRFADVGEEMKNAFQNYFNEVKSGVFPAEEHTFAMPEGTMRKITEE